MYTKDGHSGSICFQESYPVFALVYNFLKLVSVGQVRKAIRHNEGVVPCIEMLQVIEVFLSY